MRLVSFFDQPLRVTRFKLVHAQWRRQRMEVLPGVAPVALLLARTDDTVVGLTDVRGYPNGFVFVLRLRWRLVADPYEEAGWPFPDWGSPDPLADDPFPDELLRFGVQFADGRRVTNMDRYPFVPEDRPPDQPVLIEGGGVGSEGGGASWDLELAVQPLPPPGPLAFVCAWPGRGIPMDYRVRPLPPPGPLAFSCGWPGRGIPSSRAEVDGAAVREAADAAMTLWLDDPYCSDD